MSGKEEQVSAQAAKVTAVQKRTFTRWVNYHISERKLKVGDLFVDLDDGLKLIALLEVLTAKQLPYKYTKDPKMKIHKLENLSQVLKYIQLQAIPLVNIGPGDINDGRVPAILGLIFSLISRYSVGGGENDLLAWVNKQIQPYNHIDLATNFTESWKDGHVLAALVDSLKNGLIDTHALKDPLGDITNAMKLAEDNFGIPQLLDPGDMAGEPDEKANMTYIALFREYVENEKKKKRDDYKTKAPRANMCYAKGEGVEGGYRGRSLPFTIFSRNVNDEPVMGMYAEEFKVKVSDPTGADVPCSYKDNRDGSFGCAYTPTKAGAYKVSIDLIASQGGVQQIRGSVYKLNVTEASDPSKSWAEGPGLIRVFDKQPGLFTVFARDVNNKPVAGEQINVTVDPKDGKKADVPIDVKDNGDGSYSVRYGPVPPGEYRVGTNIGGKQIKDMPRDVTCYEAVDPSNSIARGPGVTSGEPRVGIEAPFAVLVKDSKGNTIPCGDHDIKISVTGPKGPVDVKINDGGKGIYKCAYTAPFPGDYVVDVKLYGKDIKDNPFKVAIKKPADPNKTYAEGPGLDKAFDDRPNKFRVHAFDEDGRPVSGEPIEVKVVPFGKSPNDAGAPVELKDNGDGTYDVSYRPDKPGDYWIHTTLRGQPIKDMPKKVTCHKGSDPTKTIVEGPGVTGGFAGKPLPFTIRAIDKDGAPVPVGGDEYKVQVDGPNGYKEDVKVVDNKDGTYSGSYVAPHPGDYKVQVGVAHDSRPVGKSPYHVKVKPAADGAASFAVGAGWKEAWDALPTRFTVYAKDSEGKDVPGAEVKVSVRNITTAAQREQHAADLAKMDPYIKQRKDDERKNLLAEQKKTREEFETKSKAEGKSYKTELGTGDFPVEIRDNGDGTYLASYTPIEPGTYEIQVTVNGGDIKESPKPIPVNLTRPKVVFWQHTHDAEKAEIIALKKRLAQANEVGRSKGLQF